MVNDDFISLSDIHAMAVGTTISINLVVETAAKAVHIHPPRSKNKQVGRGGDAEKGITLGEFKYLVENELLKLEPKATFRMENQPRTKAGKFYARNPNDVIQEHGLGGWIEGLDIKHFREPTKEEMKGE
jgi:hypothetical protein